MKYRITVVVALSALGIALAAAGDPQETHSTGFARKTWDQGRTVSRPGAVLPLRDRVGPVNEILEQRLDELLPALMRETGIDMWLVINREYNEDPVYLTLVPAPTLAARRTSMLLFFDRGDEAGVERLSVSTSSHGGLYEAAWEGGSPDDQWQRLVELVEERSPRLIGIDVSDEWAFADGLSASLRDRLMEALGPDLGLRVKSAESLVLRWLETRTPRELEIYPHIVALARGVIAEGFSDQVITPGVTTTRDVAWFLRDRFAELDLPIWFMPYVNVQRAEGACSAESPNCGESVVIQRGDVLHTDVGICYLRMCTDTQELGYVLRPGQSEVPLGLQKALAQGNRWQDTLTGEFQEGRTGNEVLAAALESAASQGLAATVYSHPIGYFGHGPGPIIGWWDNQGPTPIRGDWPLHPNTAYAIEGNIMAPIQEWDGHLLQVKLEQSAVFDGQQIRYLAGRQTRWHVIR